MTATARLALRPAGLADVAGVVALVESAYRGDSSRSGWTTEADLLDGQRTDATEVRELLGRDDSAVVLAEAGGRLVGCFHLERRSPGLAYFGMLAVTPLGQGAGVGKALLTEARRRAAAWGCSIIRMTVLTQRPELIAWYERHGFRTTGETAPFPYGDERFGRPRRDDLEFVVLEGATGLQSPDARTSAAEPPGVPTGMTPEEVEMRAEVARSLRPSVFPATRDELVGVAEQERASSVLIGFLRNLPARRYQVLEEVYEALGQHGESVRN